MTKLKFLNYFLLFICLITVSLLFRQCVSKAQSRYNAFEWNAGWSAPKYYGAAPMPVEYFYKGKSIAGTSANIGADPGWGITSGGYTGGDIYKDVPDSIYVKWLCSVDGFYYEGGRKLPREKMLNLFKEKTIDAYTGAKADYSLIVAGMAPGGNVTIWMQGATTNKEIIKFKVANKGVWMENDQEYQKGEKETAMSKEFINSEANIFRNLHGIPYSVWEKGEKEYNYDIGFVDEEDKDFYINISGLSKSGSYIFFNQDVKVFLYSKWMNNILEQKKVLEKDKLPIHYSVQWTSENNKEWYEGEIILPIDFQTRYENFYYKYKSANIIFVMNKIDHSQDYTFGSIWLQSPLYKEKIMRFRLAKLDYVTRKYNVSKYSLPKDFVFPKWEGREKLTFPEIDYWQEK